MLNAKVVIPNEELSFGSHGGDLKVVQLEGTSLRPLPVAFNLRYLSKLGFTATHERRCFLLFGEAGLDRRVAICFGAADTLQLLIASCFPTS